MQASLVSVLVTARHFNMMLTDHVTLNFNMSTVAAFLDIEKAFDTTRHLGFLHKLSKLKFLFSLMKLVGSFRSQRKFRVSVEK
jgi:hypothetical protein